MHRETQEFAEHGYKLAYLHAVRRSKRGTEYLGMWVDYSFRDDQWVNEKDVQPRSKITKFLGVTETVQVLKQPLHFLRDGIIRRMTAGKIQDRLPIWEEEHEIPQLSCKNGRRRQFERTSSKRGSTRPAEGRVGAQR